MLKVVTAEEMRNIDRRTIEEIGIPGIVLMENAGAKTASLIQEVLGGVEGKNILVFCGRGNNGGDGMVVARHLINSGANVRIFLTARKEDLRGDPLTNLRILENMGIEIKPISSLEEIDPFPQTHLIIDALLGTGIKGLVRGFVAEVIDFINRYGAPVLSVDLPSGLNSDTGSYEGTCVKANYTVTMALLKRGLLIPPGRDLAGEVTVADISMPQRAVDEEEVKAFLVEENDVRRMLPRRPSETHKNQCGKVFLLAGSVGMTGAATLASMAVLRSGAGVAILGIPQSLNPILEEKLTEVMTRPLPETEMQTLSLRSWEEVQELIDWAHVLAMGPGLSTQEETKGLVLKIIESLNKPAVIDADGLNALAGRAETLRKLKTDVVLTPHFGELSRLAGIPIEEISKNRIEVTKHWASQLGVILVLKGSPTVIGDPNGNIYINPTGNAGMATAGAGDVLTGTIAGLMAQGASPLDAAIAGVYLHGLAGDLAREDLGEKGLVAGDLVDYLPEAILRVERGTDEEIC